LDEIGVGTGGSFMPTPGSRKLLLGRVEVQAKLLSIVLDIVKLPCNVDDVAFKQLEIRIKETV
jgi:hypothetical protein